MVFEYISVPQNRSEIGIESLLFSAWKLRRRGWLSDPPVWEPLTIRQRGLVMDFTAPSQVLGRKGEGLGISGWISWGQSEH